MTRKITQAIFKWRPVNLDEAATPRGRLLRRATRWFILAAVVASLLRAAMLDTDAAGWVSVAAIGLVQWLFCFWYDQVFFFIVLPLMFRRTKSEGK